MARRTGPLSWGEEAALRRSAALDEHRPEWMPSQEEVEAYLLEIRGPRILVTGSHSWEDRRAILGSLKRALKYLGKDAEGATLIHGAAEGADLKTAGIARKLGMATEAHPTEWSKHAADCPRQQPTDGGCWTGRSSCKSADSKRDHEMIGSGADILIALIRDQSEGATATLELWLKEDRPAILCRQDSADETVSAEFLNMERWRDRD